MSIFYLLSLLKNPKSKYNPNNILEKIKGSWMIDQEILL